MTDTMGTHEGNTPPYDPQRADALSLLRVTRPVTQVWVVIGVVVGLVALLEMVLALLALHFPGGSISTFVYALIWVVVDLIVLGKISTWSGYIAKGDYGPVQEPLLLWGILALIFGIVPGVLLLLGYLRTRSWSPGGGPDGAPRTGNSPAPGAVSTPPPSRLRSPRGLTSPSGGNHPPVR